MDYATFLSKTKIQPDIATATRAHQFIFEELSKGSMDEKMRKSFVRVLMSMWCRYDSLAKKYHRDLADWIIEDCVSAMEQLKHGNRTTQTI